MPADQRLPFDDAGAPPRRPLPDEAARRAAVDPSRNVVLEASAGTGKTRVLVDRYVNLLNAGVEPPNILAMTFTRKAAAEMRARIVATLRDAARRSPTDAARWRALRERLSDIAISTIDAFCLSLLREFPLEADLDPGFDVADESMMPRLIGEALDETLRITRARARTDADVNLLFARLGERRLREGLGALLDRRLVAHFALRRMLSTGPADLTVATASTAASARLAGVFATMAGGVEAFVGTGPRAHPAFTLLSMDVRELVAATAAGADPFPAERLQGLIERLRGHFFTTSGTARQRVPAAYRQAHLSKAAEREHWRLVQAAAPALDDTARAWKRDLNVILSRAVWRVFGVASAAYLRTLDRHGVLDFGELLARASALLGNMDEFARSRYLLEARYRHVLVDEFQDTSRAQWELVSQLVRAWGEGLGASADALPPSIFIVGDRKQSIYGFRDADVALLDEAASLVAMLRDHDAPVQTITHSFRSAPAVLAFVNDLFDGVTKHPGREDAFRYDARDRFPVDPAETGVGVDPVLGVVAEGEVAANADAVAAEIERLVRTVTVRDRETGVRRPAQPGDIAILFRSRESHQLYERALDARGIPTYVYKGLGFFDADEVKDLVVLIRYLADPQADGRAAAFLRSRFVRLSDGALHRLAPGLSRALTSRREPDAIHAMDDEDRRVLRRARAAVQQWLPRVDILAPATVIDQAIDESAYAWELRGPRVRQARENTKKLRAMIRRLQNRGYLTMGRLAEHLDRLSAGDESNAAVDALNAVNLMTVHASKGLEFPVVFIVNLEQGTGGRTAAIRVSARGEPEEGVAIGDFHADFDEDAPGRDAEETKRLLYVALTRARDRLYLAAVTDTGGVKRRRGSLMSVCPECVAGVFADAAGSRDGATPVVWRGPSGATHVFRVCPRPTITASGTVASSAEGTGLDGTEAPGEPPSRPAVGPSWVTGRRRVSVTAMAASARRTSAPVARRAAGRTDDRLLAGRLAHRLFQFAAGTPDDGLPARAVGLLADDERQAASDLAQVVREAVSLFAALRARPDVREMLDTSVCHYEVPFSLVDDGGDEGGGERDTRGGALPDDEGVVVRGVIDCVAVRPDGGAVVLDFKTGAPRDADAVQLEVYVRAARRLFPGGCLDGRLVYPTA